MMSWPEEPQSHSECHDAELDESAYLYPSDSGDERSQHGATSFLGVSHGANQAGLTYSASCPSFSGLDDVDDLIGGAVDSNDLYGSQEPLVDTIGTDGSTLFTGDKTLEMLLQFQLEYQTTSQRQFPLQHVMGQSMDLVQQQIAEGRRGLHGSQSLTSLSSMMDDPNRINVNSKRKKGTERWMKLQRHKSFDSTTTISESFDLAPNVTVGIPMSSVNASPDQLLQGPLHSDMIEFCTSDLSNSMQPNDSIWPPAAYGSAPNCIGENSMQQAHHTRHCHQQQQDGVHLVCDTGGNASMCTSAEVEAASELDILLLSDNERANLFDAIWEFESPGRLEPISAQLSSGQPERSTQILSPIESKEQNHTYKAETKTTTINSRVDHEHHKKTCHDTQRPLSLASSTTPLAGIPPSGCVPMRTRLHQILVLSVQNSDAGSSLSSYERNYLMQSPLFFSARAPETAGSLWLLLHAAQCESGCEIAGCSVMRRVLTHCLGCERVIGKCKQPCNDAKAMLLHYGSCNSKGSMHGRSCSVCWNLLEIDFSHQALSNGNDGGNASQSLNSAPSSFMATSPSPQTNTSPPVPMSVSPGWSGSTAYCSPSRRSASRQGPSKHVPIQPNPLPTASNPMGLMGTLPPQFRYSLSLYLEQTSAPFRAEIQSRVEKRVTAAAGQDLLQHMQKKTRLRSLDNLRLEARTTVLGEMERELHLHMQAYNWANSTSDKSVCEGSSHFFPYLTNFSVAEFGAFQAQQVTSQTSKPPAALSSSPPVCTQQFGSYKVAPNDRQSKVPCEK